VADRANKRERLLDRRGLIGWTIKATIPYRLIDHKLYMGLFLASASVIFGNSMFSDEIVRICVVREDQNLDFDVFCQNRFDRPLCRLHARSITIIVDQNLTRKPTH